jgi:CheY-like chemotaxis protein/predicted regulator of Ras-like GTPase activity (Roadblock/LC7/MglB family)
MSTVLLVDDEKNFLSKLEAGLSEYANDFSILTAENGKDAIEVLHASPVDLVVTDLKMPVMDGFGLLAYIASNFPTIPVIIMTAFGTPEVERELKANGILTLIEKPIDLDELAAAIMQGLETTAEEGALTGISLDSFVQLIEMEQKTCLLEVQGRGSESEKCYLLFNEGELYDAVADELKGEEAAIKIIGLKDVKIRFMKVPRKKLRKRIEKPLMSLLMEALKQKDESADPIANNPDLALGEAEGDESEPSVLEEELPDPEDDLLDLEEDLAGFEEDIKGLEEDLLGLDVEETDVEETDVEETDDGERGEEEKEWEAAGQSAFEPVFEKEEGASVEAGANMDGGQDNPASNAEENDKVQEISQTAIPKGGIQMAIKDILQEMAGEIDNLIATGVQGMDGVELAKMSPVNAPTEQFAARFAMVMKLEMNICKELNQLGNLEENIMQTENSFVYSCMLGRHHYLGIAVSKEGTLGMVRMVAQKYAPKFKAELQ